MPGIFIGPSPGTASPLLHCQSHRAVLLSLSTPRAQPTPFLFIREHQLSVWGRDEQAQRDSTAAQRVPFPSQSQMNFSVFLAKRTFLPGLLLHLRYFRVWLFIFAYFLLWVLLWHSCRGRDEEGEMSWTVEQDETLEFGKPCNVFRDTDGEQTFLPSTFVLCQGNEVEIPGPWRESEIKWGESAINNQIRVQRSSRAKPVLAFSRFQALGLKSLIWESNYLVFYFVPLGAITLKERWLITLIITLASQAACPNLFYFHLCVIDLKTPLSPWSISCWHVSPQQLKCWASITLSLFFLTWERPKNFWFATTRARKVPGPLSSRSCPGGRAG